MKKRLLSISLVFLLLAMMLPIYSASAVSVGRKNTTYLKTNDTITIMPAEVNGKLIENSKNYYLSVDEYIGRTLGLDPNNGPDLRIRQNDVNIKWRIRNYSDGVFNINWTNFREHESDKNWDLDAMKSKEGTIVHLWAANDKNRETQKFYLEEDGDGDPETFYIVSNFSGRYVSPDSKNWNWDGKNDQKARLSNTPYRWRIQVIDREADGIDSAWMTKLPDETLLSQMSIPGAHDAGTANVEGSQNEFFNFVATQKYFIDEQLQAGVRAFDLRVCWNKDSNDIVLVHGENWVVCHHKDYKGAKKGNITFKDALEWIDEYLTENPKEAAILLININGLKEGSNDYNKTKARVREILIEYDKKGRMFHWPGDPAKGTEWMNDQVTLGDVRGKMVALSGTFATGDNDSAKPFLGPKIENWNMKGGKYLTDIMSTKNGNWLTLSIQDNFSTNGSGKLDSFQKTAQTWKDRGIYKNGQYGFLFNYASGTKDTPFKCASHVNTDLLSKGDYLLGSNTFDLGRDYTTPMGIVMLDYVDATLCRRVYTNNSFASANTKPEAQIKLQKGTAKFNDSLERSYIEAPGFSGVRYPICGSTQYFSAVKATDKDGTQVQGSVEPISYYDEPGLLGKTRYGVFLFKPDKADATVRDTYFTVSFGSLDAIIAGADNLTAVAAVNTLTVKWNESSFAYTGEPAALTAQLFNGSLEMDTPGVQLVISGRYTDVGKYTATAFLMPRLEDPTPEQYEEALKQINELYELTNATYTYTITPAEPEIQWPTAATLMYGYSLEEAVLEFPNGYNTNSFDGSFVFENSDDKPTVAQSGNYTLQFIPDDTTNYTTITESIPVTVTKRPIRALVGNYQIEYGNAAGTWQEVVSLVGKIADNDIQEAWAKTKLILQDQDGRTHEVTASNGETIPNILKAGIELGKTGTIELQFGEGNGAAFQLPNYEISYEPGTWEIVPRTLELAWSGTEARPYDGKPSNVTAQIKSGLLPKEDQVTVTVQGGTESAAGRHTATAVLSGADAQKYSINEFADYLIEGEAGSLSVTVQGSYANSTGSGTYEPGTTVTIDAGSRSGYRFSGWTANKASVVFENKNSATTTFEMPSEDVIVTASWTRRSSGGSGRPSTGGNTGTTSTPQTPSTPTTPTTPPSTSNGPALDTSTVAIPSGGSYEFLVKGNHDTGNIKIEVQNPQVAEVVLDNANDPRGAKYRVIMKAAGTTQIRVTYQGQTSTMTVNTAPNKGSLTLDTSTYTLAPGNQYTIGAFVRGADGNLLSAEQINAMLAQGQLKVRDSRTGSVTDLKPLPNGNFQVIGKHEGVTYIIYEIGGIHASVRVEVKNGVQQHGTASRTASYFTR